MQNKSLARDYVNRSKKRIKALDTLFAEEAWADVVRESQEVVELSLKALLRHHHVEVPRLHDVSMVLEQEQKLFSDAVIKQLPKIVEISRQLRRDRELAFYGSEDLTPEEFYKKKDAQWAIDSAKFIVEIVDKIVE